jgi:hypothetical protein
MPSFLKTSMYVENWRNLLVAVSLAVRNRVLFSQFET